jgi:FkbM family methyltransferase
MSRFSRFFAHIRNNTLGKRIKYQFSDLRKWDQMRAGKRKFVLYGLTPATRLKLYPESYLSYLILRGDFEKNELDFFDTTLKPGNIFIDIGANIGLFTLLASEKGCEIYSFEPTPVTFDRLNENINLNKRMNVKTFNLALSDSKGEVMMNVAENGMDAWNNLSADIIEAGFKKIKINTDTLDNFIRSNDLPTDRTIIIKMDVEGWEKYVLLGGKNSLMNLDILLMIEFNDENFSRNAYSGKELIVMMNELGYSFFEWQDRRLIPHVTLDKYDYTNLIAVKNRTYAQK